MNSRIVVNSEWSSFTPTKSAAALASSPTNAAARHHNYLRQQQQQHQNSQSAVTDWFSRQRTVAAPPYISPTNSDIVLPASNTEGNSPPNTSNSEAVKNSGFRSLFTKGFTLPPDRFSDNKLIINDFVPSVDPQTDTGATSSNGQREEFNNYFSPTLQPTIIASHSRRQLSAPLRWSDATVSSATTPSAIIKNDLYKISPTNSQSDQKATLDGRTFYDNLYNNNHDDTSAAASTDQQHRVLRPVSDAAALRPSLVSGSREWSTLTFSSPSFVVSEQPIIKPAATMNKNNHIAAPAFNNFYNNKYNNVGEQVQNKAPVNTHNSFNNGPFSRSAVLHYSAAKIPQIPAPQLNFTTHNYTLPAADFGQNQQQPQQHPPWTDEVGVVDDSLFVIPGIDTHNNRSTLSTNLLDASESDMSTLSTSYLLNAILRPGYRDEPWATWLLVFAIVGMCLTTITWFIILRKVLQNELMKVRYLFLGQTQLLFIFIAFCSLFSFTAKPIAWACTANRALPVMVYGFMLACLLVKTINLTSLATPQVPRPLGASNDRLQAHAGLPGASANTPTTYVVNTVPVCHQFCLLVSLIAIDIAIAVEWQILRPAAVIVDAATNVTTSCELEFTHFVIANGFNAFMIMVILLAALRARYKSRSSSSPHRVVPSYARDAMLIVVTMTLSCFIWSSWIIGGYLHPEHQEPCIAFGLCATTTAFFVVIFVPKAYQLCCIYPEIADGDKKDSPAYNHRLRAHFISRVQAAQHVQQRHAGDGGNSVRFNQQRFQQSCVDESNGNGGGSDPSSSPSRGVDEQCPVMPYNYHHQHSRHHHGADFKAMNFYMPSRMAIPGNRSAYFY